MERARFGIFTFTPSTGELRRGDVPVRLQSQPAKVLALLVRRRGEIITREALQREIWGDGTHVDFERGLNFCIAQVRTALGDSAESPRFIETIPKQGYRFIAPVEPVVEPVAQPFRAAPSDEHITVPPRAGPRFSGSTLAVLATTALLLIAATIAWARIRQDPPTIVVVPFYNETGKPELDVVARSLGDAVVASLAAPSRADAVSVIGNASALRNPFARPDVQKVAKDLDAQWVMIGQLKADGRNLRLIAHLIRAADMKHVWAQPFDDPAFEFDAQSRTAEAIAASVQGHTGSR
jgi:DNA-binding winged helix-turn-helix (wHTH) protein/TolB-like protein